MDSPTLAVANVGDQNSSLIVQVVSNQAQILEFDGVLETFHRVSKWSPDNGREITLVSASSTQILLAIGSGQVVLLGLDKNQNLTALS